jgi:hypothetical protein
MSSDQQRPTEDVEGHTFRHGQDPEATDEERAVGDDTEGHTFKHGQDPEAVDEDQVGDDTEGHSGHARV